MSYSDHRKRNEESSTKLKIQYLTPPKVNIFDLNKRNTWNRMFNSKFKKITNLSNAKIKLRNDCKNHEKKPTRLVFRFPCAE